MEENFEQGLLNTDRPIIENILFDSVHNADINRFLNLKYLQKCFTGALSNSGEQIDATMVLWKATVLSLWLKYQWTSSKGAG